MATRQFSLFKSNRFWPLFLTHILGKLNNQLFKGTLILGGFAIGLTKTDSELMPFTVLVASLFILPFFLFSATGGQLADKYEKPHLVQRLKAFELTTVILLSFGLVFSNYYILLAASFLLVTQTALFTPLKYSLLPEQIEEKALIGGNGLLEAGAYGTVLFVALFTAATPSVFPAAEVTAFAMTLIAALGLWAAYKVPPASAAVPDLKLNPNIFAETLSLFKIARKREVTFLTILGIGWFWFVATVFLSQFPSYAQNTLRADGQVIALFLIIFASGISIGALLCNLLLRGLITARYVPLAAIFMALFCLDLYNIS
ncbi:MAG: MFS transporter, partial [Kordiimonas sp.]